MTDREAIDRFLAHATCGCSRSDVDVIAWCPFHQRLCDLCLQAFVERHDEDWVKDFLDAVAQDTDS